MEKTSKKLAVFSVLIATIITGVGVTFGYFIWRSTSITTITFKVDGTIVELDDGKNITGANLMPVASYNSGGKDVVKKNIKIKLNDTTTDAVTVDFKLKINSIDSGLNHNTFKYAFVNASGTVLKEGDFLTSKAGDSINLLTVSTEDNSLTTSLTGYSLYIYIDGSKGDNPNSMQNQSFSFTFDVVGDNSSIKQLTAAERIANLEDGSNGDTGSGVYKVEHEAISAENSASGIAIEPTVDYRYYGPEPNNYICLYTNNSNKCFNNEYMYRIIGSIRDDIDGNYKLKVVKDSKLMPTYNSSGNQYGGITWDYSSDGIYKNIWATDSTTTTSGSQLMRLLNTTYLNVDPSPFEYYLKSSTSAKQIHFNGLYADRFKHLVDTSRYYLGVNEYNNSNITVDEYYKFEHGTITSEGNANYWDGKIGLIYKTDYIFTSGKYCSSGQSVIRSGYTDDCNKKSWLYVANKDFWTITSSTKNNENVYVYPDINYAWGAYMTWNVKPSFYLKSNLYIKAGDGSKDNPYLVN